MDTVYLVCAVAGGAILGIQLLLLLIGFGGDDVDMSQADVGVDVDLDVDVGDADVDAADASAAAFKVISTKTLIAFVTFFGLGGKCGTYYGLGDLLSALIAVASGGVALVLVAYLWSLMLQLQSSGNVDPRGAVGKIARVYLRIPPRGDGHGKVTVEVQGRSLELSATTTEEKEIATGDEVMIVDMIGPRVVTVVRAN